MKTAPNPYGTITHALYSVDKIDKRIGFYQANGIDSLLFKFYRSVADPEKAVIGQFLGGKNSIYGARDQGEVYDKPIAKISLSTALDLFGTNADLILDTFNNFNTIKDLKQLLPPQSFV